VIKISTIGKYANNDEIEKIIALKGKICTKCGRKILNVGYFVTPDSSGVVGIVSHSQFTITDILGNVHLQYKDRCFLTDDDFDEMIKVNK
jgi:hypothetical protein